MTQELHTVAIDLAKNVFHHVGADTTGNMLWSTRLTRHALMPLIAQLPPVLIGIEACGGAHDWARRGREHGHEVKRMAPPFVKPCVKSNTNDRRDAEAIAKAVTRPTLRVVPTKDIGQPDLQALHRVRERLIGERTTLINAVHGLMHEYGIVMPPGVSTFRQAVVETLASAQDTLREDAAWATRMSAHECPHREPDAHRARAPREVCQVALVAAVDRGRGHSTARAIRHWDGRQLETHLGGLHRHLGQAHRAGWGEHMRDKRLECLECMAHNCIVYG